MQLLRRTINMHAVSAVTAKVSQGLHFVALVALLCCSVFCRTAMALQKSTANQDLCDSAAVLAARQSDVPLSVLQTITRAETGRAENGRLKPWPWTVNMQGKGVWFDSEDQARTYVFKHFKSGARSFDVGCFQINYKWHGTAFDSIDDMFDPVLNARYAAQFLSDLYAEFGDWSKAAGAYHSRTSEFAKKYVVRFDKIRAGLGPSDLSSQMPLNSAPAAFSGDVVGTENLFPLLQPVGVTHLGSLVPLSEDKKTRPFIRTASGG